VFVASENKDLTTLKAAYDASVKDLEAYKAVTL
jgi:hypothetical protein